MLSELSNRGYAERYVVWTRPSMLSMFRHIAACEVVCSQFPVGNGRQFGISEFVNFLKAASAIRKLRPSVSIDFVGDFRERFFARLIGSAKHLHIGWSRDHPHARLIRNPVGRGRPLVIVPATVPSAYRAYQMMLDALTDGESAGAFQEYRGRHDESAHCSRRVGLHPFASQSCKLWSRRNWTELAVGLVGRGYEVIAFCAPSERDALERIFSSLRDRITLMSGDIDAFVSAVSSLDIMIGLDSFAVHVAGRQGVRSVTINAGVPAELWAVPGGRTLAASGECTHYPCYNVAPCRGTTYENACVNAVSVVQVLGAVEDALSDDKNESPSGCVSPKRGH